MRLPIKRYELNLSMQSRRSPGEAFFGGSRLGPRFDIKRVFSSLFRLLCSAMILGALHAQAGTSTAPIEQPVDWNDSQLISFQNTSGNPTRVGNVGIAYYGHNAFKITSPLGLTLLVDPWQNESNRSSQWFTRDFPSARVDVVLSTQAHSDHDAVQRPQALMVLKRMVGKFRLGDVEVVGLADKRECTTQPVESSKKRVSIETDSCPPNNDIGIDNDIYIITTGGLSIAIWGDNRVPADPTLDSYLKNVDVIVLPLGNVLNADERNEVIRRYGPKIVIPSHYFIPGLHTRISHLQSADQWVDYEQQHDQADVHRLDSASILIRPGDLSRHYSVYYFGNHFELN